MTAEDTQWLGLFSIFATLYFFLSRIFSLTSSECLELECYCYQLGCSQTSHHVHVPQNPDILCPQLEDEI